MVLDFCQQATDFLKYSWSRLVNWILEEKYEKSSFFKFLYFVKLL